MNIAPSLIELAAPLCLSPEMFSFMQACNQYMLIGGWGYSYIRVLPHNFSSSQIQIHQFDKKGIKQNMNILIYPFPPI